MSASSALLKLMGHLPERTKTKVVMTLLSASIILFLSAILNGFLILVGLATAFKSTISKSVNIFKLKVGFLEARFPKSVGLDV